MGYSFWTRHEATLQLAVVWVTCTPAAAHRNTNSYPSSLRKLHAAYMLSDWWWWWWWWWWCNTTRTTVNYLTTWSRVQLENLVVIQPFMEPIVLYRVQTEPASVLYPVESILHHLPYFFKTNFNSMGTTGSFLGVKRLKREAEHSLPSSVEITNVWIFTSIFQFVFTASYLGTDNFTFTWNNQC
jgi:hypothetical protein